MMLQLLPTVNSFFFFPFPPCYLQLFRTVMRHGSKSATSLRDTLLLRRLLLLPHSCVFVLSGQAGLGDGGAASLGPGKLEQILIYRHFGGTIRPKSIPSLAFLSLFNTGPFLQRGFPEVKIKSSRVVGRPAERG